MIGQDLEVGPRGELEEESRSERRRRRLARCVRLEAVEVNRLALGGWCRHCWGVLAPY